MRKKVRIEGCGNKSNRKMGAEQQRGPVQGGGNKSNRKMGAEQQRGSMLTIPQPKRKAVWGRLEAKSSNRICFGELQSGSMRANPT